MQNWHKADLENRMYVNIDGGKKIAMPRYYKQKIYDETERKRAAFFIGKNVVRKQLAEMRAAGLFVEDSVQRRHNSETYYKKLSSVQSRKLKKSKLK